MYIIFILFCIRFYCIIMILDDLFVFFILLIKNIENIHRIGNNEFFFDIIENNNNNLIIFYLSKKELIGKIFCIYEEVFY